MKQKISDPRRQPVPQPFPPQRQAQERAAQPAEMAPIYVLLASTESSYVTGMVYGATGGQLLP